MTIDLNLIALWCGQDTCRPIFVMGELASARETRLAQSVEDMFAVGVIAISVGPSPSEVESLRGVADHGGKDSSSQAPAATHARPAARAIQRPTGVSFSRRTSSARSAIQSTFITPPTNNSPIKTQQQPTQ